MAKSMYQKLPDKEYAALRKLKPSELSDDQLLRLNSHESYLRREEFKKAEKRDYAKAKYSADKLQAKAIKVYLKKLESWGNTLEGWLVNNTKKIVRVKRQIKEYKDLVDTQVEQAELDIIAEDILYEKRNAEQMKSEDIREPADLL